MSKQTEEIDYTKPHAFEPEVGRITLVCVCGCPRGVAIHAVDGKISIPVDVPYSKHTNICLQKADDDMPLFVLKPTDASAVTVIEYWYMRGISTGVPREKMDDTLRVRDAFKRWQEQHPDRVKVPD